MLMKRRSILATPVMLSCMLLDAQKSPVADSLELHVATSDRVFAGRITHIGETTNTGEFSHTPVTIEVEQTLKGTPARSLSLDFAPYWYRWEVYPYFTASVERLTHTRRLILCITSARILLFDLDDPKLQVLTDSLNVLRTSEAVLQAAKAAALHYPTLLKNPRTSIIGAGSTDALKGTDFWLYDNYILAKEQP